MSFNSILVCYIILISYNYSYVFLVKCSDPSPIAEVIFSPFSDTTEGANISFNCEPGLEPQSDDVSVCSSNGSWVPDPAHRICSIPPSSEGIIVPEI